MGCCYTDPKVTLEIRKLFEKEQGVQVPTTATRAATANQQHGASNSGWREMRQQEAARPERPAMVPRTADVKFNIEMVHEDQRAEVAMHGFA